MTPSLERSRKRLADSQRTNGVRVVVCLVGFALYAVTTFLDNVWMEVGVLLAMAGYWTALDIEGASWSPFVPLAMLGLVGFVHGLVLW